MIEKNTAIKRKIIKHLYYSNIISCADLSIKIERSLPITTKVLNELIQEGLVIETGYAPSTGGRRAAMYSLATDVLFIVSVAMDQFVTRIVIMNMANGFVTAEEKFELPLSGNSDALSILLDKISNVIAASGIPIDKFAGIGIGMPGFVDTKKEINYSYLPVTGKNISEFISEKTKIPTYIDNDSSLIALAEFKFGAAINKKKRNGC